MPKISEDKFIEVNEKWGQGIAIDKYNNEYSIVSARKNQNDEIWMEWGYPQKYKDGKNIPNEKAIPWKVPLGVKEQALQYLEKLIFIIEGRN